MAVFNPALILLQDLVTASRTSALSGQKGKADAFPAPVATTIHAAKTYARRAHTGVVAAASRRGGGGCFRRG